MFSTHPRTHHPSYLEIDIATGRFMSTFSQGTSGPSGRTGLRPPGQPAMSGDHPAPQQISSEQSTSREIRRLIVRLLADFFNLRADYLMVQAHCRNAKVTARGTILSFQRGIHLIGQKGSSVTKEEFNALVKSLDRLGLGANDWNAVQKPQSIRTDFLLTSVLSVPLYWALH